MTKNSTQTMEQKILDKTEAPDYHAQKPSALADMIAEEEGLEPAMVLSTIEQMKKDQLLSVSKRGNIVSAMQSGILSGAFRASTRGFGFVTPEERCRTKYPDDFFISSGHTSGALNGDTVQIKIIEGRNKEKYVDGHSTEASVMRVMERNIEELTGTLYFQPSRQKKSGGFWYVQPDDQKIDLIVNIVKSSLLNAKENDKVAVKIDQFPTKTHPRATGTITAVFGAAQSSKANYNAVLHEHKVLTDFPEEVTSAATEASQKPLTLGGRLDLRDKVIFTIDSASAKDLDDAVSLDILDDGYLLGVHIADVGEYVPENSVIDKEAFLRGTSIYFADQVVPMLPRALSNGSCSLNGGVDRYALSALIHLDQNGKIMECKLAESIIHSSVRGVYAELNDLIENGKKSPYFEKYQILYPETFPKMLELYHILERKGVNKGALELESSEAEILVQEDGTVADIVLRERGITEKLIEQFMLCANEAVATWLHSLEMPCVYRVHEEPPADKLETFAVFAHNLGLDIKPLRAKAITPKAMQAVMNEANEKGLATVLSSVMLRSLSKAKYSDAPGIHFGLATEYYCHFTSPIRRYPDLTTHRFIKTILHGNVSEKSVRHMQKFAAKSAQQSSECELEALYAERDIEDLYKVIFMRERIGEEFDGVITSVTSFGFFVDFYQTCEGLVPIGSLNGFWNFDDKNLRLSCGEKQYKLGDTVRVKLSAANIQTRKMDLEIV